MRVYLAAFLSLATALAVGATAQTPGDTARRDLTVTGPLEKIELFVAQQDARRPQLATSAVTRLGDGQARAVVMLSPGRNGEDLVRTVKEARAAGLSYEYADAGPTRTRRR